MVGFQTKYIILVIFFVVASALYMQEEIEISIFSKPPTKNNEDYVVVNIGDRLDIWCTSTNPIRGMRMENIDFDSYNSKLKQLVNITWKENLKWDPKINRLGTNRDNVYKHKYNLFLYIKNVTLEHSGWQICYFNEYVHRYLYVFVANRFTDLYESYQLMKTKPNTSITIPCISPTPDAELIFLYSTNYSYSEESMKRVPNNFIYKYDPKIGVQLGVSTHVKFFCYYPTFSYYSSISVVIDEDENSLIPMFNEDFSAITHLGTDLKMECILIHSKILSFSFDWNTPILSKDMNKIFTNDFKIEVLENTMIYISSLTVKNVTKNDLGFYTCSVIDSNKKKIGIAHKQIFKKRNTDAKPIKYFNASNIAVKENDNCVLLCEASYPITWTYVLNGKKNIILKNVFIYSSLISNMLLHQSVLNINLATYENNGFYYCHETNTLNERENVLDQKIFINVVKDVNSLAVSSNEYVNKIYIQKHSPNVTIPCIPIITNTSCFLYTSTNFKKNLVSAIEKLKYHYVITFDTVIDEDLIYECFCRKIEDKDNILTKTTIIKTYETFEENTLPYMLTNYNKNVTIGEELIINCTILRYCKQCLPDERFKVFWRYNDYSSNIAERISTTEKYVPLYNAELYLSTLVIKNAQKTDSYEYECSVANLVSKINVIVSDEKIIVNYLFILLILSLFMSIIIGTFLTLLIKQVKLKRKIRNAGLSNFNKGVKGILNPRIYINLQADMLPYDTKLEISRNKIKIGQQLGSGYFGIVFKGEVFGQFAGETVKTVAIKMVKRNFKYECMKTLIIELKILCILGKHINIANLLGACTENLDKMELLVILEYCHYGNIRDILRKYRKIFINLVNSETDEIVIPSNLVNIELNTNEQNNKENCSFNQVITTNTIINWAYQISCGMEYIASRKVLHGDLAARNILLNENNIIKICDFGLSKNLSINYNYKKKTQCPLPIKWMAIESIRDKTFSTESDVWSFGVVLWEIFSLGQTPYPNILENMEFFPIINNGYRMEQPEYSTNNIYQMMLKCWEHDPKDRPSFISLTIFLESVLENFAHYRYLELSNDLEADFDSDQSQKYLETSF